MTAQYDEVLHSSVAHAAWADHIQITPQKQRLLASGVTFCSIKSLRTVPFKVICMVGMNEGDFPTRQPSQDFDLTKDPLHQRVGDQSRAEDDRAIMLETLLAAREVLYISWSGFSPRDNSTKPASVLVTQLRQYLAAQWGEEVLKLSTTEHPMQPFNRAYFEEGSPLSTFAVEWRDIHLERQDSSSSVGINQEPLGTNSRASERPAWGVRSLDHDDSRPQEALTHAWTALETSRLLAFYKNPVKDYFVHALSVNFKTLDLELEDHDREVFRLKGLALFDVKDRLLKTFVEHPDKLAHIQHNTTREIQRLKRSGLWMVGAMGELFEAQLQAQLSQVLHQYQVLKQSLVLVNSLDCDLKPLAYSIAMPELHEGCVLTGQLKWSGQFNESERRQLLTLQANALKGSQGRRYDLLLGAWIDSLVIKALDLDVQMCCLFSDEWFEFNTRQEPNAESSAATGSADDARSLLVELSRQFIRGQTEVLPMPLKTALGFVGEKDRQKALGAAREVYDGGHDARFFESQEMSLARAYPEFDDLIQNPHTLELWVQILPPFWQWVQALNYQAYETVQEQEAS